MRDESYFELLASNYFLRMSKEIVWLNEARLNFISGVFLNINGLKF
jgi:hypothetical protein